MPNDSSLMDSIAEWLSEPPEVAAPVKRAIMPAFDPGMSPAERKQRHEDQLRSLQQAMNAPAQIAQQQREQEAALKRALAEDDVQLARENVATVELRIQPAYQANQEASSHLESLSDEYVQAFIHGGTIAPFAALATAYENVKASYAAFVQVLLATISANDDFLAPTHLDNTAAGQSRYLMARMNTRERLLALPPAYPGELVLRRYIAGAKVGSNERTGRAVCAFAITGDTVAVNEGVNWTEAARQHLKSCIETGEVLPVPRFHITP